jgi:hypothetical protein
MLVTPSAGVQLHMEMEPDVLFFLHFVNLPLSLLLACS